MSSIIDYFTQSNFAHAAYASLIPGDDDDRLLAALQRDDAKMAPTQADLFSKTYNVVDQYSDNTDVSATVFEEKSTGKRYLAIRGTEIPGDITADTILAAGFPLYSNSRTPCNSIESCHQVHMRHFPESLENPPSSGIYNGFMNSKVRLRE